MPLHLWTYDASEAAKDFMMEAQHLCVLIFHEAEPPMLSSCVVERDVDILDITKRDEC